MKHISKKILYQQTEFQQNDINKEVGIDGIQQIIFKTS